MSLPAVPAARRVDAAAALLVLAGLLLRFVEAFHTYLNPDEAECFFLSLPAGLKDLYLSSVSASHPPLLVFILHGVTRLGTSEIHLRLVPVLAGALVPWFAYRWITKAWSRGAGFAALVLLVFSPNLIMLGAQMRGYTLALLFTVLAMLLLDSALETGSAWHLAGFTALLYLAILTEYSVAWFAGAAAVYFLARARDADLSRAAIAIWAIGQAGALVIYGAMYRSSLRLWLTPEMKQPLTTGYLQAGFPSPHQNLAVFAAAGTLKQFAYAWSSIALGTLGAALFAGAVVVLWGRPKRSELGRGRALAALLVTPFVLACGAAMLKVHPYGRSRQTVVLSLFIAAGTGIALDTLLLWRPWPIGVALIGLVACWPLAVEHDPNNIAADRHRRESLITGFQQLQAAAPPGALVLTDAETSLLLRYYICGRQGLRKEFGNPPELHLGTLRITWRRWDFGSLPQFAADLAALRCDFGLSAGQPVWVLDGGFDINLARQLRAKHPGIPLPAYHDADGALIFFQTPAGM